MVRILTILTVLAAWTGEALAQQPRAQGGGGQWIFLLLMVAIFYFFLIRPQTKRHKEMQAMQNSLQRGAQVVTQGGIYGRVTKVVEGENAVMIEVSSNPKVEIKIGKTYIGARLDQPKTGEESKDK